MEILQVNISELKPYEKNPRHNESAVTPVSESIKAFGFRVPILVDENNVIIAGHTRWLAAQKLGLKTVPVVKITDLSEKQVKAFRIADNKVADAAIFDNKLLLEELEDIGSDIFTGFTESDLFCDELNEDDNQALQENESGVVFKVQFETNDKEKAERVREFVEGIKNE